MAMHHAVHGLAVLCAHSDTLRHILHGGFPYPARFFAFMPRLGGLLGFPQFDGSFFRKIIMPKALIRNQARRLLHLWNVLTVNRVEADVFSVLLIPHTLQVTTWGGRRAGDEINLEVDLMARYAARLAGTLSQKP